MSTNLSADVNFLADMPVRTLLALEDKRRSAERFLHAAAQALRQAAPLFVALEAMDIDVSIAVDSRSIDVKFAGDGRKLGEVWSLLRRAGWGDPSSRPEKGATAYNAFWHHAELPRIWLCFSATACRRVQVGVQMVEQPVYEVQCGELPELPTSDSAPALEAFV